MEQQRIKKRCYSTKFFIPLGIFSILNIIIYLILFFKRYGSAAVEDDTIAFLQLIILLCIIPAFIPAFIVSIINKINTKYKIIFQIVLTMVFYFFYFLLINVITAPVKWAPPV